MGRNVVVMVGAALIAAGMALAAWRFFNGRAEDGVGGGDDGHGGAGAVAPDDGSAREAAETGPPELILLGEQLHVKHACHVCHKSDGSRGLGPEYAGQWGSTVALADGTSVLYDENYVRESILAANAKRNAAYPAIMSSYEGKLTQRELDALVLWIQSQTEGAREEAYARARQEAADRPTDR